MSFVVKAKDLIAEVQTMNLIWTLIIGLLVGVVAKLLMPGRDPGGFIITILLGLAGAFVATFLGRTFGLYAEGSAAGFIMSVAGAILLLVIYRVLRGSSVAA
jgi:uncharacterized membrane protein YeaQ/YmgE (transglycosylase-associated protein family)